MGIIIMFILGYFVGLLSCLYQVMKLEDEHEDTIGNILK